MAYDFLNSWLKDSTLKRLFICFFIMSSATEPQYAGIWNDMDGWAENATGYRGDTRHRWPATAPTSKRLERVGILVAASGSTPSLSWRLVWSPGPKISQPRPFSGSPLPRGHQSKEREFSSWGSVTEHEMYCHCESESTRGKWGYIEGQTRHGATNNQNIPLGSLFVLGMFDTLHPDHLLSDS